MQTLVRFRKRHLTKIGEVLVKLYGLTPAETRILVFLAQGMSLPEAAATLGVGEATVKTHMHNVFAKTGTNRQAEVVKLVMSALPQRRDDP